MKDIFNKFNNIEQDLEKCTSKLDAEILKKTKCNYRLKRVKKIINEMKKVIYHRFNKKEISR